MIATMLLVAIGAPSPAAARQAGVDRLPASVLDVVPPSARVRGVPGAMTVQPQPCRARPTAETRRRIIDVAVQEWAFFGFRIAAPDEGGDNDNNAPDAVSGGSVSGPNDEGQRRRPRLSPAESARVAASIAGYWAVTAEGSWIVGRQNDRWNGEDGIAARWNAPWSAAFISWVMCEAGLATASQFQRAIAHHSYIDQAIRARDGRAAAAAFVAYDAGEETIAPGDLLCSSRRPPYRTLADRRRQIGAGARSHCDIVVKVDDARARVLAIGGNVRGVVSLKMLPAVRTAGGPLRVDTGNPERPMFAHLKLRAPAVDANAFEASPALAAAKAYNRLGFSW
jgi:hypothetical protein